MPRDLSTAASKVITKLGTEPILVVEVRWTRNGPPYFYADKDLEGAKGKILNLGGLDSIVKLKSGGSTGNISVTLSDEDFEIKDILDTNDIHMREAKIYQTYPNLGLAGKFLLFTGIVATPIEWREGTAEVDFQIINKIEDAEIGFSLEEGQFPQMAKSAIGKAWPLCFGSVLRVPSVKIIEKIRGTSLTKYSIITRTEADDLCSKATAFAAANRAKEDFVTSEREKVPADRLEPNEFNLQLTNLINGVTVAYVSLLNFQEDLVSNSPTQEPNIIAYADLCIEIADHELRIAKLQQDQADQAVIIATLQGNLEAQEFEISRLWAVVNAQGGSPEAADVVAYNDAVLLKFSIEADLSAAQLVQTNLLQEIVELEGELVSLVADKDALRNDLIKFVLTSITVEGGEDFPQGQSVDIIVQGVRLEGTFSGRVFTISKSDIPTLSQVSLTSRTIETPNLLWVEDSFNRIKGHYCLLRRFGAESPRYYVVFIQNQGTNRAAYSPVIWEPDGVVPGDFKFLLPDQSNTQILESSPIFLPHWDNFVGADAHLNGIDNLPDNDWAMDIGSDVYLAEEYQDKYVANLIPSSSIHEVLAYRVIGGVRTLQPVPQSYYFLNVGESIAGQTATTITFKRPLKEYVGERWEDQIYVSLTSSEGPNTADIIKYLIDTYSPDISTDTVSFSQVALDLTNYPSHFPILQRKNLLTTVEDIAWQARCAVYLRNQVALIKYLSKKAAPTSSISESDIDFGSMKISFGETEELVTRMVGEWTREYTQEDPFTIVQRNNILKYGEIEKTFNFWIYNIPELVEKSVQFWLMRYSNTWKRLEFTTPLHKLVLEVWDTARLPLAEPWVANDPVDCIVERANYNSADKMVEFELWVPVRQGEMTEYPFAYPASSPIGTLYPTPLDVFAGGSADGEVVQTAAVFDDATRPRDLGPKLPSDSNDSLPTSPTIGRTELDYIIPDQRDEETVGGITQIDIRTTEIIDSLQAGKIVTLDTLLDLEDDEAGDPRVMIDARVARIIGLDGAAAEKAAPFDYRYDPTSEKWLPGQSFLKE
jgi:hypothetical protein